MSFKFAIDRGGTFTDIYCILPDGTEHTEKLLSVDPLHYTDAPAEGIRRIVQKFAPNSLNDPKIVESIRMGTTVATNALLENKGERVVLAITSGFRDLLKIGDQSRTDIFDLAARKPSPPYEQVIEVEERIIPTNDQCQLNLTSPVQVCTSGDRIQVVKPVNEEKLLLDLKRLYAQGIKSIAIVLLHSYVYPDHEKLVGKLARQVGFEQITLSSEIAPMIKVTSRGMTSVVDAYLTPVLSRYIGGFMSNIKSQGRDEANVLFMQSDGGLVPADSFIGSRAVLSGPAGGVVAFCHTCYRDLSMKQPIIGLDMGGTSTDVCRMDSDGLEHTFEATIAGVPLRSAQLDIRTVAAGGGSILSYRSGLFTVGPSSAGAYPGPVCYRNNGYLTVTDANVALGRIVPDLFPSVFGVNSNEPIDVQASRDAFKKLTQQINAEQEKQQGAQLLTWEQVAHGFLAVANETMCRPIRSITEGRGFDSSTHVLCIAGGAGPQHACALARSLGMKKVFIHRLSGILSAYGIALASLVTDRQEPISSILNETTYSQLIINRLQSLVTQCQEQLTQQGVKKCSIMIEKYINLRFERTDYTIMTRLVDTYEQLVDSFQTQYKREFGFILTDRNILVDNIRVRASGGGSSEKPKEEEEETKKKAKQVDSSTPINEMMQVSCYLRDTGWTQVAVYSLCDLQVNDQVAGPCIIVDKNSCILVEDKCYAKITNNGNVLLVIDDASRQLGVEEEEQGKEKEASSRSLVFDSRVIEASIMAHRFMSIAEQMGRVLQRTSISTNIKERLDFSCAIFDSTGGLVSNAPHIPVHLGSMQKAVQFQLQSIQLVEGDVILSNHPIAGGSHLPDFTVITPVFYRNEIVFFVASRGHHADIGGKSPGSMPPDSTCIEEEGVRFISFKLVSQGHFQEHQLLTSLTDETNFTGYSVCRCVNDVVSDVKAQIAANNRGIQLIQTLIHQKGLKYVHEQMHQIQEKAELAVRQLLISKCGEEEIQKLNAIDYLDDGTEIHLNITIDRATASAIFDFTGTGLQVVGNLNTPEAVTYSAILYCLRCLIGYDIPLNHGCLTPISVIVPSGSILSPSPGAAVVGGNVLTSQRIVDVIFKAFQACAASQGCMNNITLGDETFGYYETIAGGSGAGDSFGHGTSGVHTHMTNTRITDVEVLEKRYPVLVKAFNLRYKSGGRGKFNGGDGVMRHLLFRKSLQVSLLTERRVFSPYGLAGGQDAAKGENNAILAGTRVNLGGKASIKVKAGDELIIKTPGGGGYGHPEIQSHDDINSN